MNEAGEPVFLFVLVPVLMAIMAAGIPLMTWWTVRPDLRVMGMGFQFHPRSMKAGFNTHYIEAFFKAYAEKMPAAFAEIGVEVTSQQVLEHFAKVRCAFREGFLQSAVRKQSGLDDLDRDGKAERFTGLTHTPFSIEVAVVPEMGMMVDGQIVVDSTAWDYECHNTIVRQFAGYEVAICEAFVPDDDKRIQAFLGGKSIPELKKKRAVLDAAHKAVTNQMGT